MEHQFRNSLYRVLLAPLQVHHIEALRLLRNQERKRFVYSGIIEQESQRQWFEKYMQTPGDYMFTVAEIGDPDRFIGAVALYNVDDMQKTCEFGRLLIDRNQTTQKGLGFDTVMCACRIAFEQLGMQSIQLEVFRDNIPAIKTYRKAGYIQVNEDEKTIKMELNKITFEKLIK